VAERFADDFKRFFVRGLAAVLPAILTVVILIWLFTKIQYHFGRHINTAVQWVVIQALCVASRGPMDWQGSEAHWQAIKTVWEKYELWWVGFLLAFVAVYVFGRFVASIIGRGMWRMAEQAFFRLPVIRQIYPYVKQVIDYVLSRQKMEFSRVVAVEYPRKGVWTMGLVTGPGMRTIRTSVGGDMLTVFIPSSPTPVTGYAVTVNKHEVIDLPISIDDALRFVVSCGVIFPIKEQMSRAETEQALHGVFLPRPTESSQKEATE
jgi:uncharacterized membrane protein